MGIVPAPVIFGYNTGKALSYCVRVLRIWRLTRSRQWIDTAGRDNKGCWISIDGVDEVGKTVLAQHIATVLDGAILVSEFSQSLEGATCKTP